MYLALKMDLSIILTGAVWNPQETLSTHSWFSDDVISLHHQSTSTNVSATQVDIAKQ